MPGIVVAIVVAVLGTADDWAGVEFRWAQFELARTAMMERTLEPPAEGSALESLAWRRAADQALWSLDPTAELIPDGAIGALRGPDDRHGHYAGEAVALPCEGKPLAGLKIYRIPGTAEQAESEDSPQVRQSRDKKRKEILDAAWTARAAALPFKAAELKCAMEWLSKQLPAPKIGERQSQLDLAWINAYSGWIKALDKNGDIIARKFWERASESEHVADVADPGIAVAPCPKLEGAWCVADVRLDGPAWNADVRVHDHLHKIDGKDTQGLDKEAVTKALGGEPKSKVALTLQPALGGKVRELKLVRDQAVDHDVTARDLGGGIVHVRLKDFVKGTGGRLREALLLALKPKKQKKPTELRGLVLDMRGHPGGILDEAVAVADSLLGQGVIVQTRWRSRTVDRQATATMDDLLGPLVVLVDKRCASACEVLTGALQDHKRGPVLGAKTFGKASMQEVKRPNLMAEFYVKTTIGRYLTPNHRDLDHIGTQPDVALPADATLVFAQAAEPWRQSAQCVAEKGSAPKRLAADVAPRRKPDPWLEMAVDWVGCVGGVQVGVR
ncbi:MAG: hypothetical protein FJ100_13810 [Deltaproteobacteria bacterium]|nr:hypothetical protein [Deltaproteobacteria bacterium]